MLLVKQKPDWSHELKIKQIFLRFIYIWVDVHARVIYACEGMWMSEKEPVLNEVNALFPFNIIYSLTPQSPTVLSSCVC